MSNTVYPGAIDSPYDPSTSDTLGSASHHAIEGLQNDAIVALETKLGTASSTPVNNAMLMGTGTGTSTWQTSPTSPSFTTSILDTNSKTWIGQNPAGSSAVNYPNLGNSTTGNAVTYGVAGTDSNISLNLVPKGSGKVQDNGTNLIDFRSSFANFVQTGGIWSIASGLNGNMTAAIFFINGVEYVQAAVTGHTFATSKDTYVDYTVGTGITYTAVSNGATSGFTLAANSIRLAKVVTSGAAITSITQNPNSDGVGNMFLPQGPATALTLQNSYKFSVYRNAAANTGNNVFATIIFDTKIYDTGANYSTSTGQFTAPVAGFYHFSWGATTGGATTRFTTGLYKNGTASGNEIKRGVDFASSVNPASSVGSGDLQLAANDTIIVMAFGNTTTGLQVGSQNFTFFDGYMVSAT